MAAWQIPLAAQPPQIQSPAQVQGQLLTLKNMATENALNQRKVQAADMALEEQKRAQQDQEILRKAYMGWDGRDESQFLESVRTSGASPKAVQAVTKHFVDMHETLAKAKEADLNIQKGQLQMIGSAAQGMLDLKDEQSRAAIWPAVRAGLITKGISRPQELPEQYPGQEFVTMHRNNAVSAEKAIENALNSKKADAQIGADNALTAQRNVETQQTQRAVDAQTLAAAAEKGVEDYLNARNQLPTGRGEFFPVPDRASYNSAQFAAQVRNLGLKPNEAATAVATASYRDTQLDLAKQRVDLEKQRFEWQKTRGVNSSADQRQAFSSITHLESEEDKINQEREQLGNALGRVRVDKDGKMTADLWVPPSGEPKPIAEAAKEAGTTVDALVSDMKARYGSTGRSLKRVIHDKYQQYQRLGVSPNIPVEQIDKAIDTGDQKTLGKDWKPTGPQEPSGDAPENNPGNIKVNGKFNRYATPQEGWDALRGDLKSKIEGNTRHGLSGDSTILDLANIWAPKGDGKNKPEDWAKNTASYLKVSPKTPIGNYAGRLDELAQAVAFAEGSKVPFTPAKSQTATNAPPPAPNAAGQGTVPQAGNTGTNPSPAPPSTTPAASAGKSLMKVKLPNGRWLSGPKEQIEKMAAELGLKITSSTE